MKHAAHLTITLHTTALPTINLSRVDGCTPRARFCAAAALTASDDRVERAQFQPPRAGPRDPRPVSYTHLRAHETLMNL
eukprot:1623520-Prymnesium_polylepis.1